jgi:small subunit ribosomal protein S16
MEGEFTLDDFLEQMQQLKKMGPLGNLLGMMPGMPKELKGAEIGDDAAEAGRGDHPVDDRRGAQRTRHHRRLAPGPHRQGVGAAELAPVGRLSCSGIDQRQEWTVAPRQQRCPRKNRDTARTVTPFSTTSTSGSSTVAVRLRLTRVGKKKQPTYRIVAADRRSPRDGRFIEIIGTYNPRAEPSAIKVDNTAALKWLKNGAQPSERVKKLLELRRRLGRPHHRGRRARDV